MPGSVLLRSLRRAIGPIGKAREEFAAAIKADAALWTEAVNLASVKEKQANLMD
jgi:hypothetical protein